MKKLLSVLLVLCLFIPSALAGWEDEPYHYVASVTGYENIQKNYQDFWNAGEFSVTIPGLTEDFIPQGIAYYAPQDLIIFSGYTKDEFMPCALMAVERSTNKLVKEIFLAHEDGSEYKGHSGGVCVTRKNIYISDDNHLYRISLDTFLNADNSCVYNFEETISVPCTASFCQYNYGVLWVGEFERTTLNPFEKQYETDPSHHLKVEGGKNTGWVLGYELTDTENEFDPSRLSASGAIPNYILSTTERIQGFTISRDLIYLSQSYGRKNSSTIYRHRNVLRETPHSYTTIYGTQVPLWVLDKSTITAELVAPPMSESLCTIDERVYIAFESGAAYYRIPLDDKGPAKDPVDRVFRLDKF
ncbi:MAG: hypothetical protein IJA59_05635 [Clostridia bacterium]|nr:hypothetical protein [Clostridia bacterium]